mmetsp:Transcript_44152/g.70752  ORF Transcript_44152/g.70752 Transcript_44152/m.70752 type:complete len:431 (-) Transcript_44152:123-1415(-)
MDDFWNLLMLCGLMFALTYIIGYLPMIFKLSETKLESISIFGAGFLLGTALIVIVPEGLSVLMETSGILHPSHEHGAHTHSAHNRAPTDLEEEIYEQLRADVDIQNIEADLDLNVHVLQEDSIKNARRMLLSAEHVHDHKHDEQDNDDEHEHAHHHTHDPIVHSVFRTMGCLICFGFIFMMGVEKFGAHSHSHGAHGYHHKDRDAEQVELLEKGEHKHHHGHHHHHGSMSSNTANEIFSFMVGLLTHSAVDGIALGAVSAEGNAHSLSILVFVALMAHKGPAAVSMTAFLKRKLITSGTQESKISKVIMKQLVMFSSSAPIFSLLTYLVLNSINYVFVSVAANNDEMSDSDALDGEQQLGTSQMLGYCLLFSGGTFLYVVTLHIIPEIKEWRQSKTDENDSAHSHADLTWTDLLILTVGCVMPSLFEHSH